MANLDNPNGFIAISGLDDSTHEWVVSAGQGAIAKGDAVIRSGGTVCIAASSSGSLLGIAAGPSNHSSTANGTVLVYDDPKTIFEGQCSGTFSASYRTVICDIEGTTGIMEVNEDATAESVICIIKESPGTEIGANSRVMFRINKHQLGGYTADQTA